MRSKWFWGLFFILAALAMFVHPLGWFGSINIFTVVVTIFMIPVILSSIRRLEYTGIFFPLGLLLLMYRDVLGFTLLSGFQIMLVALFLTIGCYILYPGKRFKNIYNSNNPEHFGSVIDEPDEKNVIFDVRFASAIKYINTNEFKRGEFNCSFGALKVYMDQTELHEGRADIVLNVSFGGVELYIPKNWSVQFNANNNLGGIDEKNRNNPDGKNVLVISGNVNFAGVEIVYV